MPRLTQAFLAAKQATARKHAAPGEQKIVAAFALAQRVVTRDGQTGTMKQIALPTTELTVDEVMRRWPPTIRVFLDFRMHCVGCPIQPFHTVEEACREHGIDLAVFFAHLQTTASSTMPVQPEAERDSPSARPHNA